MGCSWGGEGGKLVHFSSKSSVIPTSFEEIHIGWEFPNDTRMTGIVRNDRDEIKNGPIFPSNLGWRGWRGWGECAGNDRNRHSNIIPVISKECHFTSFQCSNDHGMNRMTPNDGIFSSWTKIDGMTLEWWNDIQMTGMTFKWLEWHWNGGMKLEWWNDIGMMEWHSNDWNDIGMIEWHSNDWNDIGMIEWHSNDPLLTYSGVTLSPPG